MAISSGRRLGPYEVISLLGAGGMGEVWKARDTRLERTVAIKVLPSHLSSSPEVRQRFEREAKTISQLSHPHICALYDVGSHEGIEYLVMEYLEGQTLAARLAKGPIPAEQLLRFGVEMADALDKAHRQGIVHRDLKPGNVMLTASGVKLVDFGLARFAAAPSASPLSVLPTQAGANLTAEGTILGTFQYMAPEQLEGREADARSDIFAFGAVLYEMATGEKAFSGKSQASLIASILEREPPPISSVRPMTPPALDRVVKTCLAKDPEDRWQSARDVGSELKWVAEGSQAGAPAVVTARRRSRERLAWIMVVLLSLALSATLPFVISHLGITAPEKHVTRLSLLPPEKATCVPGTLAVSPDGRRLAFVALTPDGKNLLWVRPLDSLDARPLPGSDGASSPFWSPDSRFLGFFAEGKLKKIEASGGPPQTLCDAPGGRGGSWNREGTIVFAPTPLSALYRVSAAGGQATPLTALDGSRQENSHRWPSFLPDGRHFVYFARSRRRENRAIYAGSLDSKETRRLMLGNSNAAFAPPGYLLFVRDGILIARPFDAESLQLTGEPFPVAEKVRGSDPVAAASFTVSDTGVLAYWSGSATNQQLVWFGREGRRLGPVGPRGIYLDFRLSPDQKRVALDLVDVEVGGRQIWLLDLARGIASRLTSGQEGFPVWSPDGSRVLFASDREGRPNLSQMTSSGVGGEEPLLKSSTADVPTDWSLDGRYILYESSGLTQLSMAGPGLAAGMASRQRRSLWMLPLFGDRKPAPVVETAFDESQGTFSPDGRRIAYVSDESGRPEVYVQTFPVSTGKWRISSDGGSQPLWRGDGKELFYLAPDRRLMGVRAAAGPSAFDAARPEPLFELPPTQVSDVRRQYAATADGQRFLVNTIVEESFSSPITVVLNWTAGLEK